MMTIPALVALASLAAPPSGAPLPGMSAPPMSTQVASAPTPATSGVSSVQFQSGGWTWVPTLRNGRVESFVGLRNDPVAGANLATVWFRRGGDGGWEALSWEEQDQSRTIATVKATLGLPDTSNDAWPVAPSRMPADQPERLIGGVLESDEFAPFIEGVDQPDALVQSLEDAGWKAAWIDAWAKPCPQDVVLESWVTAVEGAQAAIAAADGQRSASIDVIVDNTISQPCGGASCRQLFSGVGSAVVLHESSPGAIRAKGVVVDATGRTWGVQDGPIPAGTAATSALLQNTGMLPATVLVGGVFTVEIAPGAAVAVADSRTPCSDRCTRFAGTIQGAHGSIPVYCFDPACYCCCWASMQPKPPTWLAALPNCPCTLTPAPGGGFMNPNPAVWEDPAAASGTFHPGASHCIRQTPFPGVDGAPGQQCCYDAAGKLITVGAGAGTPDQIAPGGWWPSQWDPVDTKDHYDEDVVSFHSCSDAKMLDCYLRHRPPNNGKNCACNPPNHPHCTKPPSDASCPCDGDRKPQPVVAPVR